MALVVARQEHHRQSRHFADAQRTGWLAPRACDPLLAHILKARKVVDAGPADDAENSFGHGLAPLSSRTHRRCDPGSMYHDRTDRRDGSRLSLRSAGMTGWRASGVARHVAPHLLLGEVHQ